jgi:peptide/nickel transport system permease protein
VGLVTYTLRRLIQVIPTVVVVVTAIFLFLRLAPGDPAAQMLGLYASDQAIETLRRELGLDRPLWVQYLTFWKDSLSGDLGESFRSGNEVIAEIGVAFLRTLQLASAALVIAIVLGLPLGILAATTRSALVDRLLTAFASLALAAPVYWIGLLMMLLFALKLRWLPASGVGSWEHLVMPAFALALTPMAHITRLIRASLLEALSQPFITVVRAKGVRDRRIVWRHALSNALLPAVTQVGLQFGNMLGGAVLTEAVFAWPGLGLLVVNAVYARDYPVIQAAVIALALIYMLINLLVDITYSLLDPRIQHA